MPQPIPCTATIIVAGVCALLVACGGGESAGPPSSDTTPSAISVTASGPATVVSGSTVNLSAVVTNKGGTTLIGQSVTWSTSDTSVATVSTLGVAAGIHVGQATIKATTGAITSPGFTVTVNPGAPATLAIRTQPIGAFSGRAFTTQPVIEIRDAANNLVTAATNQVTASIASGGGTLSGTLSVAPAGGVATFTDLSIAGSDGSRTLAFSATGVTSATSAGVALSPPPSRDFAITDAQFTQGVQTTSGSIPIVLSGNAAVVNVLIRANSASSTPMQVVLRLFNAAGTLVRTDTALATTLSTAPVFSAPSVQFLVPASVLQAGMRWQVVRDPRNVVADDVPSNDVFPATGTQALTTVTVPPIKIRFVPIVLSSHNNAMGQVTDAMIPDYLRTFKSVHPIGVIDASVGAPFTTAASFGTAPSGGDATFWTRVLGELDLARIADPTASDAHWYGVVLPPAGFNFTAYGGFAYIPASPTAAGANTRTALGVQLNWFSRPTQARDLVAHELAHNFGRSHAPCGGAAGVDPNYPVPSGALDVAGHDVYSWATGLTTGAATVPVTTGDVMGYCFPVWSSTYTYQAVLAFRGASLALTQASSTAQVARTRVLIIRGAETRGEMHLEPAFTMTGRPSIPASGPYRVTGLDASGSVLFSRSIELATIDHAQDIRHFTLAIPATPALELSLREIRVTGPAAETRLARVGAALVEPGSEGAPAARAARLVDGTMSVSCTAASTRGILVLDDATGSVIAVSSSTSVRAATRTGSVTVLCSDGVTTTTLPRVAPN